MYIRICQFSLHKCFYICKRVTKEEKMSYQFDSYVNRQEANALKDMIFKRVRERADAMTGDVKADVMNVARESFVSQNNPFSQILTQTAEAAASEKVVQPQPKETTSLHEFTDTMEAEAEEVGFPLRKLMDGINNQNRIVREQMNAAQIQNNMIEAREGLTNKKSFMGALEFLNSQAAVSLLNKRAGHGIDMVV